MICLQLCLAALTGARCTVVMFLASSFVHFGDAALGEVFFFSSLGSSWFLLWSCTLMVVEIIADIVPLSARVSHAALDLYYPLAAAVVSCPVHHVPMIRWLLVSLGVVLALSVHVTRAAGRMILMSSTARTGNVKMSLAESSLTFVIVLLLLCWKALSMGMMVLILLFLWCAVRFVGQHPPGTRTLSIEPTTQGEGWGVGGGFGGVRCTAPAGRPGDWAIVGLVAMG